MLAWVTNVLTSPDLNIEQVVLEQTAKLVENFVYEATEFKQISLPECYQYFNESSLLRNV